MNDYNFKPFDKVLVRAEGYDKWMASFYSHYDKEENVHMLTNGAICIDSIPYEGNEHLLGTTDEPNRWRAKINEVYYCVNTCMEVIYDADGYTVVDDARYKSGNYFRTKGEAQAKAQLIKQILIKDE